MRVIANMIQAMHNVQKVKKKRTVFFFVGCCLLCHLCIWWFSDGTTNTDCGICIESESNAKQIYPNCPCIGNDGSLYDSTCCGNESQCKLPLNGQCDWCSGNNHPHFDLDVDTFNHVCGSDANKGHCILKTIFAWSAKYF